MKKIKFLSLALATMCALFLVSCDQNDTTINENAIANGTETINFSVQVIPTSLNGKVAGLKDVKVTVNQNGSTQTKTTNESGIVAFDKFKEGDISIYVKGPEGFVSLNTSRFLECVNCAFQNNDSEQTEYNQYQLSLPRLGATLRGKLLTDLDFNAQTALQLVPASAVVIAKLPIGYEPNIYKTSPGADGVFQFTNLPEGVVIDLSIDFKLNNNATPVEEKSFFFDLSSEVLDINNPRSLGNVTVFHN